MRIAIVVTFLTVLGMAALSLVTNWGASHLWPRIGKYPWLLWTSFVLWVAALCIIMLDGGKLSNPLIYLSAALLAMPCVLWVLVLVTEKSGGVPRPPRKYFVHDYALLTTKRLIGRQPETEQLSKWISPGKAGADCRVFVVQAIGGQGKSVLARTWFNNLDLKAAQLQGGMWWSFYKLAQPDGSGQFEEFLTYALAYVEKKSIAETANTSVEVRQQRIVDALQKQPFLLVLDGFERLMTLYTTWASSPPEDEIEGALTTGHREMREAAELRVGRFLQQCASAGKSRILITSRLYPADLERLEGGLREGCCAPLCLGGLNGKDALELWSAMGAGGTQAKIQKYLAKFENHPLLIQSLAGEVNKEGGDFDSWLAENPEFDPAVDLKLKQWESHILLYASRGLSEAERRTLYVIASATLDFDAAAKLLVRTGGDKGTTIQPFTSRYQMKRTLRALRDRGLLGWKEQQPDLELHPIIRDYVREFLKKDDAEEKATLRMLRDYFREQVKGKGIRYGAGGYPRS